MGSARAGWNRLPSTEARPVAIATKAIPGTKMVSSAGLGNAEALIGCSIDEAITLAAGKSSAVVLLGSQQNIHTVAFNNDGAEGRITIAGSADNKTWSNLGSAEFSRSDRVAQVHFATSTVKYFKVSFESEKGGAIRSFEVLGDSTDKDYKLQPKEAGEGGATVNLASTGGARPIYAFPTPINVGEMNYLNNVFKFAKSRDKYRTIVYDLGTPRTVKHFATSYSQRPVRIEVFAFEQLPEKKDWRGKLTLDPAIFDTIKPVAVGEDARGVGHLKISPAKAVTARYVALRFEPNYQRTSAVGSFIIGAPDAVAAAASPEEAVSDAFGVLPGFQFTAGQEGAGGDFTIGGVEFGSSGNFQMISGGGQGGGEQGEQGGQDENGGGSSVNDNTTPNNNSAAYGVPYIAGAPGSAPATLPQNFSTNGTTNNGKSKAKGKGKGKGKGQPPVSP